MIRFFARVLERVIPIFFPYRYDWIQASICTSERWAKAHLSERFGYRRIFTIRKMERFFEEIERAPPIRGIYQVWPTGRYVPLRNIRDFILCYLAKESPDQTVKPKISKTVEKLLVTSLDRDRKTSLRGLAQELWNEERRYNYKPNELQFIGRKIHKGFLAHNNDAKKFPIDSLEEFECKLCDFLDAARYSLIQRSDAASGYGENANFSSIETENVIAEPFLRSDLALWEKSFDLDEIFNTAIDCYVDFSIASHQALESTECDKLCREIIDRFEDRAKYKGFEEQNDFKEFLKSCSWGFQKVTLAALAKNQAVSGIYRTAIDSLAQLSTREFLENPLHGSTDLADQYNFKAYLSIVRFLINEGRIDELETYGLNEQ